MIGPCGDEKRNGTNDKNIIKRVNMFENGKRMSRLMSNEKTDKKKNYGSSARDVGKYSKNMLASASGADSTIDRRNDTRARRNQSRIFSVEPNVINFSMTM
jgi:hypothetical protein